MKLEDFVETYDNAPSDIMDFAYAAEAVEDDDELAEAAKQFLLAHDAFLRALESVDVTIG